MTTGALGPGPLRAGSPLRTPRAAAFAGIIFSVLMITALVLLRVSAPAHPADAGAWLTDPQRRAAVAIALNLVPFAGIAFLWFIGVLRDRIGEREDRFFATVFLGSGLLFVAHAVRRRGRGRRPHRDRVVRPVRMGAPWRWAATSPPSC